MYLFFLTLGWSALGELGTLSKYAGLFLHLTKIIFKAQYNNQHNPKTFMLQVTSYYWQVSWTTYICRV